MPTGTTRYRARDIITCRDYRKPSPNVFARRWPCMPNTWTKQVNSGRLCAREHAIESTSRHFLVLRCVARGSSRGSISSSRWTTTSLFAKAQVATRQHGMVLSSCGGVRVVIQLPDGTTRTVVAADIASVTFADAAVPVPAPTPPAPATVLIPFSFRNRRDRQYQSVLEHEYVHVNQALMGRFPRVARDASELIEEFQERVECEYEAQQLASLWQPECPLDDLDDTQSMALRATTQALSACWPVRSRSAALKNIS